VSAAESASYAILTDGFMPVSVVTCWIALSTIQGQISEIILSAISTRHG
jgi:hypothetical protein